MAHSLTHTTEIHWSRSNFFQWKQHTHDEYTICKSPIVTYTTIMHKLGRIQKRCTGHIRAKAVNEMVNCEAFMKNWSLCEMIHRRRCCCCCSSIYILFGSDQFIPAAFLSISIQFYYLILDIVCCFVGASNFLSLFVIRFEVGFWLDFINFFFLFTQ